MVCRASKLDDDVPAWEVIMPDRLSPRVLALATILSSLLPILAPGAFGQTRSVEEGYVTTADGVRLFYRKAGSGSQTVIVPLGFMLFQDFQSLAKDRIMIFYDMRNRGHSDSLTDTSKISIQADVDDLEAVRRHFNAPKVSLIGESYLGMMVVLYATQHPEHVERIVQIGPVPRKFGTKYPPEYTAQDTDKIPDPAQMKNLERLRAEGFEKTHPREYCEQDWAVTRTMLVGNPVNAEKAGPGYCEFSNEWPTNLDKHFEASIRSIERLQIRDEDLARVTMPVLTIHGTRDRNAPYGSGREWAATLPDARLLTVEGAAHFPWLDNPALVFSSITDFLSGHWPVAAQKFFPHDESTVLASPAFTAQGAFLALVVTDLNASVRWYESNLGFREVKHGKSPRVAAETVILGGHNIFVELIYFEDRTLAKREVNDSAPVAGPMKTGAILGMTGFDSLARYLRNHGVELDIFQDKEMGVQSFIIRDNDGNIIQFFTPDK
jgi:pimeloyl-ACP methyl ester carboxylesterase/catechol 2,3-dioxygenase-like lactoylglutathione lyase family enzyme